MNSAKVLLIAVAFMIFAGANAQQAIRGDICQSIPGLTIQQQQKIDKLSVTHQKKMDNLRMQFRSEFDAQKAVNLKTQMNTEMLNHYRNITGLLTPEQKTWYDQSCNANNNGSYYPRRGLGRGARGYGRGQGRGRGAYYATGYGTGYGAGAGQGLGRGAGRGRGRYLY